MHLQGINPNKLHESLSNAGITCTVLSSPRHGEHVAKDTWITFSDGMDMDLVQQVIDAHDTSPTPVPLSEIDKLKISQAEQFEALLELIGGL